MTALQQKVADLESQATHLDIECTRFKAQRDALSHALATIQTPVPACDTNTQVVEISDECSVLLAAALREFRGTAASAMVPADCKNVSINFLAALCWETMQQYQVLIAAGADVPGSPQEQEINRIFLKMQNLMIGMFKWDATLTTKVLALYGSMSGAEPKPVEDLPQLALDAMRLSEAQKDSFVAAHVELMSKLADICGRYQALVGNFASSSGSPAPAASASSTRVLQTYDLVLAQLADAAEGKSAAMQEFAFTCYRSILTPVQIVRAEFCSLPHIVDIMAVAGLVVAERSSPAEAMHDEAVITELLWWISEGMKAADADTWPPAVGFPG